MTCRIVVTLIPVALFSVALDAACAEVARRPCASDEETNPSLARRGLSAAATVIPGAIVHGTGHWALGRPCTARRIAVAGGFGFGAIAVGGSTIVFTGASRYLMAPAITLTVAGFGLFITSFAADAYGVSGAERYAGEPELRRPTWEARVGLLHVNNPLFDYRWLVSQQATVHWAMATVSAALDTALDGTHARYRAGGGLRALGPRPDHAARDGSFFDLQLGLTEQRYEPYGFVTDSVEMLATGRLDLVRVGPSLRGSFAELSTGLALARTRYTLNGISVEPDFESLLLGRIAFGAYLGRGIHQGSEVMLYYDHRHDDYAAGMKMNGLGSGTIGHLGISGHYYWSRQFGIGSIAEVGSAYVAGISLLARAGGYP